MADPNNIQADQQYRTAIAERGKFFPVDNDYLSTLQYPLSGAGKYAVLTYQVNPSQLSLSGDIQSSFNSENTVGEVATTYLMQTGGIGWDILPTPVDNGDAVLQWHDRYGATVIAGYEISADAVKVQEINPPMLDRFGPEYSLSGVEADVTGTTFDVSNYHNFTIHIQVTNVTLGATVEIQHSLDNDEWVIISSDEVKNDDNIEIAISNQAYRYLRTRILNYQDGTYSTLVYAGN
jgi:hypothetical protein